MKKYLPFLSLLVLIIAGLYTRVVHLLDYPAGLNNDSALNALSAMLLEKTPCLPFITTGYGRETLPLYWMLIFFRLFGYTVWALKFSSAVISMVTIISLFFFSYFWFSPLVSIVSSLFLIFSRWDFLIGKLVFRAGYLPLFSIWMVHFLFLTIKRKKTLYLILAGVFSGLALLTYEAGKTAPLIGLFIISVSCLANSKKIQSSFKKTALSFLVFTIVSVIVYSPMLFYASSKNNWQVLLGRGQDNFIWQQIKQEGNYTPFIKNFKQLGNRFNPLKKDSHNPLNDGPLVSLAETIFLIIGILISFKRKKFRHLSIVAWFAIGLLPSVISRVNGHRDTMSIAPLALLVGLSVNEIASKIRLKHVKVLLIGGILLFQAIYFFQKSYSQDIDTFHFNQCGTTLAKFLSQFPQTQKIYYGHLFTYTIRFIAHRQEIFKNPLFNSKNIVFYNLNELSQKEITKGALIILPNNDDPNFLTYLQTRFPGSLSFTLPCIENKPSQRTSKIFIVSDEKLRISPKL